MLFFGIPLTPQTMLMGAVVMIFFMRLKKLAQTSSGETAVAASPLPTKEQTLKLITSRRTIMPKEFGEDEKVSEEELEAILEAANWAPTHQKCEPWRYSVISGIDAIEKYLDFLECWYDDHAGEISIEAVERFHDKLNGIRKVWPYKASFLLLIGMKRQAKPDKKLPEWEEISAVAMSVQNMHLMATSLDRVGGFWSSHTWCREARDSPEIRRKYFGELLDDPEDRVFGAFVLGKYPQGKTFTSTRSAMSNKVIQ